MLPDQKEKRKKLLIICPNPEGYAPGQRLKYEQYFDYFRANGYDITVTSFITEPFQQIVYQKGHLLKKAFWTLYGYARRVKDLFRMPHYDLVYVFLWVAPFAPPVFEKLTRKLARKLLYDIDDAVFLIPPSSANPIANYLRSPKNHISLMRSADHVITCTPYLDNFVRKYNTRTTDISSTINTQVYRPKADYQVKEKLVIGWSGSHSTSKYLHLLDNVFRDLAKDYDFKLVVMGDPTFHLAGVDIEVLPWKESYEVDVISSFDIGVYPLPEEEWVLGKSGLKALQYMAIGIPTVATAFGTIFRIINHGENGFLVKTEDEWKAALGRLIEDETLRRSLGRKAAETVEKEYSINANKDRYLKILNDLTS